MKQRSKGFCMTHLPIPCPRCQNSTLRPPEKRGNKLTCLCDSCGKRCGYSIVHHADGSNAFVLYLIGGMAKESKVLRSHRLPYDLADLNTQELIFYARQGMEHKSPA